MMHNYQVPYAKACVAFHIPTPSDWQCELVAGTTFRPQKGQEPCAFHRLMQRLILGFKWRKVT